MKKATLGRDWVLQTNLEIINSGGENEAGCFWTDGHIEKQFLV